MLNPSLNRGAVSRKAALLTAVLALLFVLPLAAFQVVQQPATGKLAGGVYDTSGNPIPNATVLVWSEIDKTRQITITNAAGLFELDVPIGPHVLHVAAKDFLATVPETFTMAGGATLQRTITLIGGKGMPPSPVTPQMRVGGSVMQAKLVTKAAPRYPVAAKAAGLQGTVILEAVIGADGSVVYLRVVSGHPDLAKAAFDAVGQWRYQPTLLNGQPIEVVTTVTVTFSIGK